MKTHTANSHLLMAIKSVFGAQKNEKVWLWWREASHAGGLILSMERKQKGISSLLGV